MGMLFPKTDWLFIILMRCNPLNILLYCCKMIFRCWIDIRDDLLSARLSNWISQALEQDLQAYSGNQS